MAGIPMNRSPIISASNVSQTGFLIRSPMILLQTERKQAERIGAGETSRKQVKFGDYLKKRSANPGYTFLQYLRDVGGAIEE